MSQIGPQFCEEGDSHWGLDKIVTRTLATFRTFHYLTECELNILWKLGKDGPQSLYDLSISKKAVYFLPDRVATMSSLEHESWKAKAGKAIRYDHSFVSKVVDRLESEGLVQTRYTSGPRTRREVKLTFIGILTYLQNSGDSGRYSDVPRNYPNSLWLFGHWNSLVDELGRDKCMAALKNTVTRFVHLRPARFTIRPLNIEFESFIPVTDKAFGENSEREVEVDRYLRRDEASLLRDCYVAYLLLQDLRACSGKNIKDLKEYGFKSQKEIQSFENRTDVSILEGKKLQQLLPKCSELEYLFTGMFVEELLWSVKSNSKSVEQSAEKTDTKPIYDIEVKEL